MSNDPPMKPSAIVFDFDGTIADTEWPIFLVVRDAYRAHGLDRTLDDWVDTIGRADNKPLEESLADALGHAPDPAVMEAVKVQRREYNSRMALCPGVTDVISAAQRCAVPLAIASSSPAEWVESHLERLGLLGRFGAIRTRDHVDRGKPAPDLFLAAAAALEIDPAAALAIEDSRHGCASAKAAGMTCVVVPNRITALDVPPDADVLLDSLVDFPYARFGLAR